MRYLSETNNSVTNECRFRTGTRIQQTDEKTYMKGGMSLVCDTFVKGEDPVK
jgi:hypothetical protein